MAAGSNITLLIKIHPTRKGNGRNELKKQWWVELCVLYYKQTDTSIWEIVTKWWTAHWWWPRRQIDRGERNDVIECWILITLKWDSRNETPRDDNKRNSSEGKRKLNLPNRWSINRNKWVIIRYLDEQKNIRKLNWKDDNHFFYLENWQRHFETIFKTIECVKLKPSPIEIGTWKGTFWSRI